MAIVSQVLTGIDSIQSLSNGFDLHVLDLHRFLKLGLGTATLGWKHMSNRQVTGI